QEGNTNDRLGLVGWRTIRRSRATYLLSLSYFFSGYVLYIFVFWFFLYLIDIRGFTILSGGFFTSIPFLMSIVLTPTGGALTDFLSARIGPHQGRRIVAITG